MRELLKSVRVMNDLKMSLPWNYKGPKDRLPGVEYKLMAPELKRQAYTGFRLYKKYPTTKWFVGLYSDLGNAEGEVCYLEKHEKEAGPITYEIVEVFHSWLCEGNFSDFPKAVEKEIEAKYPPSIPLPLVRKACPGPLFKR